MVIVFDLDDTLYDELSFVKSGFHAVAQYLSPILNLSNQEILILVMAELQVQREMVFDRFLLKQQIKSQKLVKECLRIYRKHEPEIELFPEALTCLKRLFAYPIYIVTDGNTNVQKKKFGALGLESFVRKCFYTYAYGIKHRKPSPYCFEKICQLEQVPASSVVYIADNPHKDFVGLKPLGFRTIRILTGFYRFDKVEKKYEADLTISSLNELNQNILESLMQGVTR